MKKTILFILPNLNNGGAERVLINILKYNYSQKEYNIKLLLIDNSGVYFDLIPEYVEILTLNIKRVRYALIPLIKKVNEIKPDIVFTTLNRTNILVLLASYFFKNKPKIIIREPSIISIRIKNKELKWWQLFLIRFLYKKADKIIAQTEEMKEEICKHYKIDCKQIEVLINPVDKDTIDKMVENAKNPFKFNYKNFIAVGRLSYVKGFDWLIKAFAKVVKEKPNFRLYIIGEGEEREKLENLIKDLKMENNIFLLGYKKNPYVYMKYADALILSSRWEGLPNVVLEALYLNTKIISTKVGRTIEDMVKRQNGQIIEFGNDFTLLNILKSKI